MKLGLGGKRSGFSLGFWFVGLALLGAILVLPGAKAAASPTLYVIIFGGLFVGLFVGPTALGVRIISEHLRGRGKTGHS